jgi:acyl carrier protein
MSSRAGARLSGVVMTNSVEAVVTEAIARQAKLEPSEVDMTSTLDELGLTSLDLVEIIMSVEDEYDITIPLDANEAAKTIKTVGDIVELARKLGLGAT